MYDIIVYHEKTEGIYARHCSWKTILVLLGIIVRTDWYNSRLCGRIVVKRRDP